MGRHSDREGQSAKGSADRARKGVRRFALLIRQTVLATVLVAVGLSLGIVAGTVSDLPDLLYRRMQEQPQVVDLDFEDPAPADLSAFADLQAPGAATLAPAPPQNRSIEADPPAPAQVSAAPAPEPTRGPGRATKAESADRLIASIARRRSSSTDQASVGSVVQVASYRDRRAADALSARLQKHGFEAFVSTLARGGEQRYRVRVRPGSGIRSETVAAQLAERGFSVWVTRE